MWGEGKDRHRYEAGSVLEVPADIQEKNSKWMKPTDDPITKPPPAPKEKGDK
jgi:hypothetical protein